MNIQQFDYDVDILSVVLWQYNEATNLLSLLNDKQEWYDLYQTQFWENWYNQIFNLSAPNPQISLFGLAVWSIILDVPLFVPIVPVGPSGIWGFNAFDPSFPTFENTNLNFNNAPFAPAAPFINLTAPQQQFLLLLKYFNCTNRGTISIIESSYFKESTPELDTTVYHNNYFYSINQYLLYLCVYLGNAIGYTGTIYCQDNLNMTITYVFTTGDFPSNLFKAIKNLDLLPRPSGVAITNY